MDVHELLKFLTVLNAMTLLSLSWKDQSHVKIFLTSLQKRVSLKLQQTIRFDLILNNSESQGLVDCLEHNV